MPAVKFFKFANLLFSYENTALVTKARVEQESKEREQDPGAAFRERRGESGDVKKFNDITHNPELMQYFG